MQLSCFLDRVAEDAEEVRVGPEHFASWSKLDKRVARVDCGVKTLQFVEAPVRFRGTLTWAVDGSAGDN